MKAPAHSTGTRDRGGILASQTPQSFFPSVWRSWIHLQILLQLLEAGRWGMLPLLFTHGDTGLQCDAAFGVIPPRGGVRHPDVVFSPGAWCMTFSASALTFLR